MKRIPVREFMNGAPPTSRPDAPLAELVRELSANSVRSMAVTDAAGSLVGVVSETDLFLKEKGIPFSMEKVPTLLGRVVGQDQITGGEEFLTVTVREVMTSDVVTVGPDVTLEDVAWLMCRKKLSLLPVVSDGTLVGEVRRIDVLRVIYSET